MIRPLSQQWRAHFDRGYDSTRTRNLLKELDCDHDIARAGGAGPIQAGKRWVVERADTSVNEGLRQASAVHDKCAVIIDFCLTPAATLTVPSRLLRACLIRRVS